MANRYKEEKRCIGHTHTHTHRGVSVSAAVRVVLGCSLFFLLVASPFNPPARAQQPPHEHNWTLDAPIDQPYIWFDKEYLRCGEVTALYVGSIMDTDKCINPGCSFYNGWAPDEVHIVGWSDNGAGGKFGYLDGNGNLVESGTQISHYKASDNNPRTVHITLTVDDAPMWADDPPSTNPANVGNLTVWEFTISNGAANWGRPELDKDVSFTATITPATDHKNPPNSMARFITFWLTSSREPGWCLNATREHNPRLWNDTYGGENGGDNDLKFLPDQAGFVISSWDPNNALNYDHADTDSAVLTQTVRVRCLDYGAYGYIEALANLPPDTTIFAAARREGTLPQDNESGAEIPIDENDHYIYDGWQWDDPPATAWDDFEVGGHVSHIGDGFTYYEEYWGFKVNGAWKDLNPMSDKDVFVLDYNNLGTGDFSNLGVTIHNLNTVQAQDEFDNVDSRVINYRWRTAHNGNQHGIFLYRRDGLVDEFGHPRSGYTEGSLNGAPK